jgi:hypothetical protein
MRTREIAGRVRGRQSPPATMVHGLICLSNTRSSSFGTSSTRASAAESRRIDFRRKLAQFTSSRRRRARGRSRESFRSALGRRRARPLACGLVSRRPDRARSGEIPKSQTNGSDGAPDHSSQSNAVLSYPRLKRGRRVRQQLRDRHIHAATPNRGNSRGYARPGAARRQPVRWSGRAAVPVLDPSGLVAALAERGRRDQRLPQFIVGMLNCAPSLMPEGQRAVTVLVRV